MSIYASIGAPSNDWHQEDCPAWVETEDCIERDDSIPCRCGPIKYEGSHLYPDPSKRSGSVDIASIPDHCHPDATGYEEAGDLPNPYLRLSVDDGEHDSTVILELQHVRDVARDLLWWLRIQGSGPSPEDQGNGDG